jgi:phytoene dehydrogenase-like protein
VSSAADGFDAVVVGAGPNGLLGALVLAEAGQRVLLVEAAERVGGALRTEELTLPGFRHDVGATVLPLALASPAFCALRPALAEVTWAHSDLPVAHPLDGESALLHRDVEVTADGLGRDGAAWRATVGATARSGDRLVAALMSPLTPALTLRAAPALARYGASGALPASVLARAAFRTEPARALLAGLAGHAVLPLHSLTTAGYATFMAALAHRVGWPVVAGGSENLAIALRDRLIALGAEIKTATLVRDLDELPRARSVLLDLTPRQVLALLGDRLPARYARRLARFRYGPGVFKLDWALAGPVPWRDPRVGAAATVHLGGTFAEIAASERDVSRGRHPDRPYVILVQPTVADPSRAPVGQHTLWAYCHVPNGSTVDCTVAIEAQIERFAPGFAERVLARSVLPPAALERFDANLVGGDVGGGAGDVRQFLARPVLSAHPWRTPLTGVYLCSASTPPGGGVHGMGGWHAAHLALRDGRSTTR